MSTTIIIIIATSIVSVMAFNNRSIIDKLIFHPPSVSDRNEWYRFFTCGLIHADIMHLLFNMFSLYALGQSVEHAFVSLFGERGQLLYILMYVTALAVCLIPTYVNHKHDYYYRSLGASGAVSAVVFVFMFLFPQQGLMMFPLPIPIPGFIFGPIYLVVSTVLAKRGHGNINHSAHLWGALYGIVFVFFAAYWFTGYNLIDNFIYQVQRYILG